MHAIWRPVKFDIKVRNPRSAYSWWFGWEFCNMQFSVCYSVTSASSCYFWWYHIVWHLELSNLWLNFCCVAETEEFINAPYTCVLSNVQNTEVYGAFVNSENFSIRFWRQYVSLFTWIAAIVHLLLTSDRKSSRCASVSATQQLCG